MVVKSVISLGLLVRFQMISEIKKAAFVNNVDLSIEDLGGFWEKSYAITMTGEKKGVQKIREWLRSF